MHIKLASSLFLVLVVINSAVADTRIDFFLSARNLPDMDPFSGAPDTFVEVWYAPSDFDKFTKIGKTSKMDDTNNPAWDEMFNLYLYGAGASSSQKLKFEVIDADYDFDDHIGTVETRLHALVTANYLDLNIPSGNGILSIRSRINSTFARGQPVDERFTRTPTTIISFPSHLPEPDADADAVIRHYRNEKL